MKKQVPLLVFFLVATTDASDLAPGWAHGWNAYVWNTYCELRREYHIPNLDDPDRWGFLTGTAFNKAFVRFSANTRLHGDLIPKDSLSVVQFHLYVYPESFPVADSDRIVAAELGGFRTAANVVSNAQIHVFSLDRDDSMQLLNRFIKNERVDFRLHFADGAERQFSIYPSGDKTFYVWAEMFKTCIRQNTSDKLKYF